MLHCPDIAPFNILLFVLGLELTVTRVLCVSESTVYTEYFKTEPGIFLPFLQCKLLNPLSYRTMFFDTKST